MPLKHTVKQNMKRNCETMKTIQHRMQNQQTQLQHYKQNALERNKNNQKQR